MTKLKLIDVTPSELGLRDILANDGHSVGEYFAELCDNSVDAKASLINIQIKTTQIKNSKRAMAAEIIISDDGQGISPLKIKDCLKIGHQAKTKGDSIGRYGVGLKSAAFGLGKKLTLITKQAAGEYTTAVWDTTAADREDFKIRITPSSEQEIVEFKNFNSKAYGTMVKISNLHESSAKKLVHHNPKCQFDIKEFLSLVFSDIINSKVVIKVNEERIKATAFFTTAELKKIKSGEISGIKYESIISDVKSEQGIFVKIGSRLINTKAIKNKITAQVPHKILITLPSWESHHQGIVQVNNQKNNVTFDASFELKLLKALQPEVKVSEPTSRATTEPKTNELLISKKVISDLTKPVVSNFDYIFSELNTCGYESSLEEKLEIFHSILPLAKLKPTGNQVEYLFQQSLMRSGILCEVTTEHEVGADLVVQFKALADAKISMKSGQVNLKTINDVAKTEVISLSSYRTSSYNTLESKLTYCQNCLNEEDMILSVVAKESTHNSIFYTVYAIDPKDLKLASLAWQEKETANQNTNYTGAGEFLASFSESMSGQLWLHIPLTYFKKLSEFEISC